MSLTINAQIDRVEPPFWYAGMHNPELDFFYGKNAQYEVTTSNSIAITNIKKQRTQLFICYHQH
jgi:hypothetical protein